MADQRALLARQLWGQLCEAMQALHEGTPLCGNCSFLPEQPINIGRLTDTMADELAPCAVCGADTYGRTQEFPGPARPADKPRARLSAGEVELIRRGLSRLSSQSWLETAAVLERRIQRAAAVLLDGEGSNAD